MPYARLTLGAGVVLTSPAAVATELSALISRELDKRHELTAVSIQPSQAGFWMIGGSRSDIALHLDVFVTAGTNSDEQKRQFLSKAMAYFEKLIPDLPTATYIVVHGLPASDWGYAGRTQADRAAG